ncbi:RNA-binding protein lark [Esox lucius]|uniref:RNA-binding protein 14 n=1 Tax=Esox lucius TaxID=8010 RepID=A0AAY5KPP6_ESOLU|nr:RNA-binding protein lark [Esox lucius]
MVKIFVGNVNSSTTEPELRTLFEKYGQVSDCDILKNYGFVHMNEEEEAQKAVAELHKYELNGARITVEFATTKVRNATKIYVGNVPEGTTAAKIRELFQPFGKVVECDIVKNFAFVHMQREKDANEAISKLNHSKLEGQKIIVSISRNNQARNGRRDDYPLSYHHYSPYPHHYLPPRAPHGDYYPPCGRLPRPPLPPPPPRAYYEHDLYERSYYERGPYELLPPPLPQQSLTPQVPSRYYRERSPLASQRNLLPPPSSAGYPQSGDFDGGSPPSSLGYALGSGFDKDDYFEENYSNGFVRGY